MAAQKEIICYGQTNTGKWCQEFYDTMSRNSRPRAAALRKAGFEVFVSSLGNQITGVGRVKMTMITIHPGKNEDTFGIPKVRLERI